MSLTTARTMIFALLLALLFQTDQGLGQPELDRRYWEAVHLLEVRGDAAGAADALLALAEHEAVKASEGRLALVHAQAGRALLLAGGAAEAEHLLLLARSEAEGTPLEDAVTAILQQAQSARPPGALNTDFLQLIEEQLQEDDWSALRRYGRRLLPYARHLLTEAEPERVFHEENQEKIRRLLTVTLPVADEEYATLLQDLTLDWNGPELARVWRIVPAVVRPVDPIAVAAVDRLLLAWSAPDSVSRARTAVEWMVQQLALRRSAALEARLADILSSPDDLLAPFAIQHLSFEDISDELALAAALSPQPMVAELARAHLGRLGALDLLAQVGEDATVLDRKRIAAMLVPVRNRAGRHYVVRRSLEKRSRIEEPLGSLDDAMRILQASAYGEGVRGERSGFRTVMSPDPELLETLLPRLLADDAPEVRAFAILAAVGHGQHDAVARALDEGDPELLEALLQSLPYGYPRSWDLKLLTLVDGSKAGLIAAKQLAAHASRLTPEELTLVERFWGAELADPIAKGFQGWAETAEGPSRLLAWIEDGHHLPETRWSAFEVLAKHFPARCAVGFTLLDHPSIERAALLNSLREDWAPAIAARAYQSQGLAETDAEGLLLLWEDLRARKAKSRSFRRAVQHLLDAPDAAAIAFDRRILQTSEDAAHFLSSIGPCPYSPIAARVVERLLELSPLPSAWTSAEAFKWYDLERGLPAEDLTRVFLESPIQEHRQSALRVLDGSGATPSTGLQGLVASFLQDPAHASLAASVLTKGPSAEDYLDQILAAWELPALADRELLLASLGRALDDRVVPMLLDALGDRDLLVARAASKALDRIKKVREERQAWEAWQLYGASASPVAALMKKAKEGATKEVRIAAIESLGTLQAPEALPLLVDLLESPDPAVVAAATRALEKINE